ncbi:MAG: DUF5330 domain-containing protein [Rhizobiaceae bacterium]|nr:DUF5330 domain-containing protein [Rhizobiaceae bacterium]
MGFLIRMTFWFSLVLLLLPLNTGAQNGEAPVAPLQALLAARAAVSDIAGICERQPDVCETGASAFHTIAGRAREGTRMVLRYVDEDDTPQVADTQTLTGSVPAAAE